MAKKKLKRPRRPDFRFSDVGIPVGAILSSKYDASVQCTVIRDNVVEFEGREMKFTEATRLLKVGAEWAVRTASWLRPASHWKYRKRLLVKIYDEKASPELEGWQEGEEELPEKGAPEGAVRARLVNWYERDPKNRKAAIKKHGVKCFGCGLKMEDRYGKIARGFIHIHHVKPISTVRGSRPSINDLVPLCPNCHAVVHLEKEPLSTDRLKELIRNNRKS